MLPSSNDPILAWFERAIFATRAQYDRAVLQCWEQLGLIPQSRAIKRRLYRLLEPYLQDAKDHPPIILRQPGLESDVWRGPYPLGEVVDTCLPANFDPANFAEGPLTIIAGAARQGKSTLMQNFVRGFLRDGRATITIIEPQGSNSFLVDEFPGQIEAINLHQVPMGLFQEPLLRQAVLADWAEIYNSKLSRGELSHADCDLSKRFAEQQSKTPYSLVNLLEYLQGTYWRNPLDPSRHLRRTLCMGLEGLLRRCPALGVAIGADPAKDISNRNRILLTEDFCSIQDLRFVCTFYLRSLMLHLQRRSNVHNRLTHVLVFDDALDLFHRDADKGTETGMAPIVNILTRIGKWGVATFILTQSLQGLSGELLANTQNMIVAGSFANDDDLFKATNILGLETRQ